MVNKKNRNYDRTKKILVFPMNGEVEEINRITREFLTTGKDLMRRLGLGGISDSQLPRDLSNWITSITEQLLALMPQDYPDYKRITEIRSQYINNQDILLPSARSDVCIVMKNLSIAYDCVTAALNCNSKEIPPENMARIYYAQLKKTSEYAKADFIKRLKGKEDGKTRRTAMLHIYGRIYLWIQSMVKLNGIEDCLALASCLRAILELYIDFNLFFCSSISGDVDKYFSFQRIEKWNKARSIVELRTDFNLMPSGETTPTDKFLAEPNNEESKINELREQVWGKSKKGKPFNPKHWSNMNLVDRVKLLGNDIAEMYVSSYYYCNFLVHSMYYDALNNAETVHLFNYRCYYLSYNMFIRATKLINKVTEVLSSKELEDRFKDIEDETFKCFFGEMVKSGRKKNTRISKI